MVFFSPLTMLVMDGDLRIEKRRGIATRNNLKDVRRKT